MGASISWSCAKAENKPDLKTRIFKTERLTSIARLSLRAATGHIQPPSTTAKTPIDSVARFIMYSSQGRILILPSFRCRGRGVYMPAVDTSYPALDTEVTKLREGSLLRCEGSYECFAGDPDVSSSTLLRLRFAADARDTRPSWVRVASKQAGARIMSDPVSEKVLAILASVKRIPRDKISMTPRCRLSGSIPWIPSSCYPSLKKHSGSLFLMMMPGRSAVCATWSRK